MSYQWQPPQTRPSAPKVTPLGWVRVGFRLFLVCLTFAVCIPTFGLLKLGERMAGRRPSLSLRFAGFTLGLALRAMGLRLFRRGKVDRAAAGTVANHSSWLDILAIYACRPVTFVAKSEVSGWGFLGWLSRISGTIFVERSPSAAKGQSNVLSEALAERQHLVFFPEGTSTDGTRVLEFRAPLFQPFVAAGTVRVQPVTLIYSAADGALPTPYGWYGGMDFLPHALEILALAPGRVTVTFHPSLDVAQMGDRKSLASAARAAVVSAMPPEFQRAT